jgi:hypothetical protein
MERVPHVGRRCAHPVCKVQLTVLQVSIATHECYCGPAGRFGPLPSRHQQGAGVHCDFMYCQRCLELRCELVLAEPLICWNEPQQSAVAAGQWQRLLSRLN